MRKALIFRPNIPLDLLTCSAHRAGGEPAAGGPERGRDGQPLRERGAGAAGGRGNAGCGGGRRGGGGV